MRVESAQEIQELVGFVVLGYLIDEEFEEEKRSQIVRGETVDSATISDDAVMRVIGEATEDDWRRQCELCGDPYDSYTGEPYVGFLKVVAE